ncbi:MAG: hypothetical protein QXT05_02485, partial [Candidatus Bilamarchaeaceae archaeon]
MIGLIGIKLNEGTVKIKEDVPPKGITIDLKIDKITRAKEQLGVANVGFTYTVSYAPNTAVLQLTGDALITEAPEELDKIIKMWKEKHRLDEETGET